ncbi:FlgB family protein [Sulfitobacter albidus]|uniref:FlgB family protein n=1 Tax=Sulfitobacter albidus TaxID=2829501 RepID=A0A975JDY4_9RHOB|nr:FlgB family protein [Sulfitobacter albidus]QUJ76290.1 FlgB family protein [Sulfitobacter albidus]
MFDNLNVFRMASSMAQHAGQQQALISQNVAHADTPGYRGSRLPDFASLYTGDDSAGAQRATRARHLHGNQGDLSLAAVEMRASNSPNGNTISLETELLEAAQAKSHHDRALAIYKSGLDTLRATMRK